MAETDAVPACEGTKLAVQVDTSDVEPAVRVHGLVEPKVPVEEPVAVKLTVPSGVVGEVPTSVTVAVHTEA